jgi:hypothetical protein
MEMYVYIYMYIYIYMYVWFKIGSLKMGCLIATPEDRKAKSYGVYTWGPMAPCPGRCLLEMTC